MKTHFKSILIVAGAVLLTACGNPNWTVEPDLPQGELSRYQTIESSMTEAIANYEPESSEDDEYAPYDYWVDLALAKEKLGKYGEAVDLYLQAEEYYPNSRAINNNLAKIYERFGKYNKAADRYQNLIDHFQETNYYYDLARMWIKAEDAEKAMEAYENWKQLHSGRNDPYIYKQIKELEE